MIARHDEVFEIALLRRSPSSLSGSFGLRSTLHNSMRKLLLASIKGQTVSSPTKLRKPESQAACHMVETESFGAPLLFGSFTDQLARACLSRHDDHHEPGNVPAADPAGNFEQPGHRLEGCGLWRRPSQASAGSAWSVEQRVLSGRTFLDVEFEKVSALDHGD